MDNFLFISNNTLTDFGLSGGDRILCELIRNWSQRYSITLLGTDECINQLNYYKALKRVKCLSTAPSKKTIKSFTNTNYFFHALNRTTIGTLTLFKYWSQIKKFKYIYSASDFYPDTLPAFFIKLFHPKTIWIAGFYLFAPKPWQKNNPYKTSFSRYLTGLLYWFTQLLSYFLVYNFSDIVCVTSTPDIKHFISKKRKTNKIIVVRGGVDLKESHKYLQKNTLTLENKKYRAVFMGRLHHQKGVLILIDIWKKVCDQKPNSQLALIGDGQLLADIKKKIKKLGLNKNITLFGFVDGAKKFKIFKSSSIVVHPATYDRGGMACAEAMAWGLPGVSFDLEALKTYYPKGLIKTKCFDIDQFASNIIKLSSDKKIFSKYSRDAINLMEEQWSWNSRSLEIIKQVFKATK
jgi:glycosyltransferase involved in cell wall biosynthesis